MKRVIAIITVLLLIKGAAAPLKGQIQTSTLYFMNLPQNQLLNPALAPTNSFHLGLPAISGVGFTFNTNLIKLTDIIGNTPGDSVITLLHPDFDQDSFLDKVGRGTYINPSVGIQTLAVGFRVGNDLYFTLGITDRMDGGIALPGDIFSLALRGNEQFVGSRVDLSDLDARMAWYREYSAGFSKSFTPQLRLGGRVKFLTGIAGISADNRNTSISVLNDYSHRLNTDIGINISAPVTVVLDGDNNIDDIIFDESAVEDPGFFFNMGNNGFGIDLGAVYQLNPRIELSAALNGLGYIRWKQDVTNITANNEFTFSGFDLSTVIDGTKEFDEMAEELLDSLIASFVISDRNDPFTTYTPANFSLGASYGLTESISVGVLTNALFTGGRVHPSLMLSANANLGSVFTAGINYTAINRSFNNIGAGFGVRLGPLQLYTIADRIPLTFNELILPDGDGASIFLPDNWNTMSLRFGLNLVFGNRIKKRSDAPMLQPTQPLL